MRDDVVLELLTSQDRKVSVEDARTALEGVGFQKKTIFLQLTMESSMTQSLGLS